VGATVVSTCANCDVGKYANFAGNPGATSAAACTACATGKTTVAAGSSQEADCLCQSGFTRAASGNCVVCEAGKYKAGVGNGVCDQCAAGKYLDATGSTAESACKNCPANSASPAASIADTACTCVDGYTKEGSTCAQCAAGKYGDPAGSCATCVRGKYSETRGATSDATCVECAVGKYSDVLGATGVGACQDCPAATLSPAGSSSMDACVAGVLVCSVVLLPSLPLTHMYM